MTIPEQSYLRILTVAIAIIGGLFASTCPSASADASLPARQVDKSAVSDNPYFLRIIGEYGIENIPTETPRGERLCLVCRYSPINYTIIVKNVRKYGLAGRTIFGTTAAGWFIVELLQVENKKIFPKVSEFASLAEWNKALAALDIAADPPLLDPDQQASTRPASELHPKDYWVFRNFLGLSDRQVANVSLLVAFGLSLMLGVIFGRKSVLDCLSLLFGGTAGFILLCVGDVMCCSTIIVYTPVSYGIYRLGALMHRLFKFSRRNSAEKKYCSRAVRAGVAPHIIEAVRDEIDSLQTWLRLIPTWDNNAQTRVIESAKRLTAMGLGHYEIVEILRDVGVKPTAADDLTRMARL